MTGDNFDLENPQLLPLSPLGDFRPYVDNVDANAEEGKSTKRELFKANLPTRESPAPLPRVDHF